MTPENSTLDPGLSEVRTGASPGAVSWAAVMAGTAAAAAITLVMMAIGSGVGFASVSPWADEGISLNTLAVTAGIWLIATQWVASALGGYLAGRLRTRWAGTPADEVFFRDTAHGFITWAVASLVIAVTVAMAGGALAGKAVDTGAQIAAGAAQGAMNKAGQTTLEAYDVDTLFRPATAPVDGRPAESKAEATRILSKALLGGGLPETDRSYLASEVAARTGVSAQEAQQRLDELIARVKEADAKARSAADVARKAASVTSLLNALAMLIGAFIACVAAALGGRERDLHP